MTQPESVTPAAVRRFIDAAQRAGVTVEPRVLEDSARSAAEAAAALGCTVSEIAKSIVFRRVADGAAVVVVTSGDRRVDRSKVEGVAGALARADADFVRRTTGYAIGGVPPLGHGPDVVVLADRSLDRFEVVWAAAGHPHAVFPISPADLVQAAGGEARDLAEADPLPG